MSENTSDDNTSPDTPTKRDFRCVSSPAIHFPFTRSSTCALLHQSESNVQNDQHVQEVEALRVKLSEACKYGERLLMMIDSLNEEKISLKREVDTLSVERKQQDQRILVLENSLEMRQQEISDLKGENEVLIRKKEKLQRQKEQHITEKKRVTERLFVMKEKSVVSTKKLDNVIKKNEKIKLENEVLSRRVVLLKGRGNTLSAKNSWGSIRKRAMRKRSSSGNDLTRITFSSAENFRAALLDKSKRKELAMSSLIFGASELTHKSEPLAKDMRMKISAKVVGTEIRFLKEGVRVLKFHIRKTIEEMCASVMNHSSILLKNVMKVLTKQKKPKQETNPFARIRSEFEELFPTMSSGVTYSSGGLFSREKEGYLVIDTKYLLVQLFRTQMQQEMIKMYSIRDIAVEYPIGGEHFFLSSRLNGRIKIVSSEDCYRKRWIGMILSLKGLLVL